MALADGGLDRFVCWPALLADTHYSIHQVVRYISFRNIVEALSRGHVGLMVLL